MALGVEILNSTGIVPSALPTDVGTAFLAMKSTTGPTDEAVKIESIAQFTAAYGARAAGNQVSYDWVDTFFREGGGTVYCGRYDTDLSDALDLFTSDLGPGSISAPVATPNATTQAALVAHAAGVGDRYALYDSAAGNGVAELTSLGSAFPATNSEYGFFAGPHVAVPSAAIGGSDRIVAGSAVTAGLIARATANGSNPNRAPAGRDFPLRYVSGLTVVATPAERESLLDVGINLFANVYGVLCLYGFQTARDEDPGDPFWQANAVVTRAWITAQAKKIGENYMFKTIDGQGRLAAALSGDLVGMLLDLYTRGGLYGEIPAEAFSVNVDQTVNTVDNIAQGILSASVEARISPHAKTVRIPLISIPVTGNVA